RLLLRFPRDLNVTLVAHGHLPAAIRSGSRPAAEVDCEARYIPITQFIFLGVNTFLNRFP
ncbi:hypothetical protein, partial [Leisingera caerulea]|uniref:hypothetical protein n=1 Tax=Leisingera caerulea TaxID=506591 RepID=UPI003F4ACED2